MTTSPADTIYGPVHLPGGVWLGVIADANAKVWVVWIALAGLDAEALSGWTSCRSALDVRERYERCLAAPAGKLEARLAEDECASDFRDPGELSEDQVAQIVRAISDRG